MSNRRKIKVPSEHRRVAPVPGQPVASQSKYLTLSDGSNTFTDDLVHSFGVAVDIVLVLSDSYQVSDSLSLSVGVSADVADAFLFLDNFVIDQGNGLGFSDSFVIVDSVSLGKGLSVVDAVNLTDSIELNLSHLAELSDAMLMVDSIGIGLGLSVEDQVALTDYLALGPSQPLSDSFSLSDALTLTIGYPLIASDAMSQTDGLAIGYGLAPIEQLVLADSIATFGQIFLTIQESMNTWDDFLVIIPQGVDFAIQRTDSFSLNDSITLFSAGFKTFADSLALSDAYAMRGDGLITFSDQFTLSDSATKTIDCRLSLSDNAAGLNDNIALLGNGLIVAAESINNLADAYSQRGNGLKSFTEQLTQTDTLSMIEGERKTLADNIGTLADGSVVRGSIWDIAVTQEQLILADAVALSLDSAVRQVIVSDSFTLTDSCATLRGPRRWNDSISVSTAVQNALTQNLSDSLPVMADSVSQKFIRWRDSISVVKVNAGALTLGVSDNINTLADAVSSARVQFSRPTSDLSVGLWSTTPLFDKIDEPTASDVDLIVSATNPANDTCECLMNAATDPVSSVNHVLSYRYKKSSNAGRQIDLVVRLMQGSTIIVSFTHTNIGSTIVQADQTLTGTQADSITNYGDLRVRFVANAVGTGTGRAGQVTWAEFRCPK